MSYYLDIAYKVIIKITYLRIQEKLIFDFLIWKYFIFSIYLSNNKAIC